VWTVTRLLRLFLDALLRRKQWFALFVLANTIGVVFGAAVLYMLFVTIAPLAQAVGRSSDSVLLVAAVVGALIAIAVGVVISATERPQLETYDAPQLSGRRVAVR
jgi:hypothetical protein